MPMSVTMRQTRKGESGTDLVAGSTYTVSDAFGAFLVGQGYASDTNGALTPAQTNLSPAQISALVTGGGNRTGNALARKLTATGGAVMVLMSDSTGNEPTSAGGVALAEWYYLWGVKLAARYPSSRVEYYPWDDVAEAHGTALVIQSGVASSETVFDDTFSGSSADLNGRTPDVSGNVWAYVTSNATGDWSVSGGKAVRSSDSTGGTMLFGGALAGDSSVTLTGVTLSTVGDTAARWLYVIAKHADANNQLLGIIAVETNGTVTARVSKRIAGTLTTITSVANAHTAMGLTAATAGQTLASLTVSVVGTTVSLYIGGTLIVSGSISAGEASALAAATLGGLQADVGVGGTGPLVGLTIDRLAMTVTPTAATTPTIKLYQFSKPGTDLSYQSGLLDAGKQPAGGNTPDAVFFSSCHNYGTILGPAYITAITPMVSRIAALYPAADLVFCSQNPRKSPDTKAVQMADRGAELARWAGAQDYGYIASQEKFRGTAGWQSLINADGIHPTQGTPGTGSALWADAAEAWYVSRLPAY